MISHFKSTVAQLIALRDTAYADSPSAPSGLWKSWLQKLSYVTELSEQSLQHIRLHVGMGFFIGASWSGVYYEAHELRLHLKAPEESKYIRDYDRLTAGLDDRLAISELDPLREEIAIRHRGKYITEDVLRAQTTISNLRLGPRFRSCVEIGAGYGALANQVLRAYDVERYHIIDYPEVLFYAAVWSHIVSPNRTIAIFNGHNQKELERADLVLVPNFLQPELDIEADLLINENSFCEMSEAQVKGYLDSPRLRCKYLYSNNRDRQFMNGDLSGLNALLAQRYKLSPDLDTYGEYYRQVPAGQRWNMKYIFWAAPTGQPEVDITALHGLTIRTQY